MNIRIRNIAIILVVVLLAGTIWIFNSSGQPVHSDSPAVGKFTAAAQDAEEGSYEAYLKQHGMPRALTGRSASKGRAIPRQRRCL